MVIVRHALQLVKPAHTAMLISTADSKINFFILFGFLVNKINELLLAECAYQHTSCRVFRLRAGVNANAASSTHSAHQRKYLLELRRHRILQFIRPFGDDLLCILKRRANDFVCAHRYRGGASHGLIVPARSD